MDARCGLQDSIRSILTSIAIVFGIIGCNSTNTPTDNSATSASGAGSIADSISSRKLENGSTWLDNSAAPQPRFERMSAESTGIDFINSWQPPQKYQVMVARAFSGAGVTVGDVDGDGLLDVYFSRSSGRGQLYKNLGDFRFNDITESAGLADDTSWCSGAAFADIDNDGDLDLYVCGFDCANRLFINDGAGRFQERAKQYGLDFVGASVMMSFADYDNDGDLDGYLATNRHAIEGQQVGTVKEAQAVASRIKVVDGRAVFPDDLVEKYSLIVRRKDEATIIKAGQFGRLFRNNNDGTFSEVAHESGIVDNGLTLSATWWDYNQDGWPDLYVANDFYGPDRLYRNNKDGTFSDVIAETLPHTPWFSMGADIGDINNDGRLDFFASDMSGTTHYKQKLGMGDMSSSGWFLEMGRPRQYMRNAVYLNTDSNRMREVAQIAGVANSDWTWSPKFGDLDNDGDLDIFVTNGMSGDWSNSDLINEFGDLPAEEMLDKVPPKLDANLAFENKGNLQFKNVGEPWGLGELSSSYGAALADLDNDGDLDILTNDFDARPQVYRNHSHGSHRVAVSLQGVESNRNGLGAFVTVETNGGKQIRYATMTRGFMSTNSPVLHFGLGKDEKINRLEIQWPSGCKQKFAALAADRHYTIIEKSSDSTENDVKENRSKASPMFAEVRHSIPIQQESPFRDFDRQPLLPNQLSQLGPGIALGDIDGDGDEDLFVGGPANTAGRICINRSGYFSPGKIKDFSAAAQAEDMGAVFADLDSDGDQDLYVVSGGVECEAGDALLRDRFYLNDGKGSFTLAADECLPELDESGSCVCAADFDRDGDLDLFVGGRVVPGQYPRTPNSYLLVNESSGEAVRFVEKTSAVAKGLQSVGMVTSALWTDVDDDGWIDLLVACEWGPIQLFRNQSGQLSEATAAAGLADHKGWWNGLSSVDIDNDGDLDYLATNFGLNTKYSASPDHPATIFYHDFDSPGEYRIVEAHLDGRGQLIPVRGRSCSSNAMPFIGKQCSTFHDFAVSSLIDLYGDHGLEEALRLEINELRSMLLRNDGKGNFSFEPLGRLAQIAPGFGVAILDANADGNLDAIMAQNFFGPQRETGRMDGGLGLLMLGNGTGTLEPVSPAESGVVIPGDAKSASILDIDLDGVPDVLVSENEGPLHMLRGGDSQANDYLQVKLVGTASNQQAIGARVTAEYENGSTQAMEVGAGGSYLSQNSTTTWFGTKENSISQIKVRWPNGKEENYPISAEQESAVLIFPGK